MNGDFHYYATYCAAIIADYKPADAIKIAYSAQLVDFCTRTFLKRVKGPMSAATTQLQSELADARTDLLGLQDITRIWASFHFLPGDLHADAGRSTKRYRNKYRLICGPNGDLLLDTVRNVKGKGLEATGLAMHVLADTWAHMYFAGTPSLVINNTDSYFYELVKKGSSFERKPIVFSHNPAVKDDPDKGIFVSSIYQSSEDSIMNLGHGRAGHLPDYSFIRYAYLPAWGRYKEVVKDNPEDYYHAFTQMIYALKYLKGVYDTFEKDTYDTMSVRPYRDRIRAIIGKRQRDATADWKAFAEELGKTEVEPFDLNRYISEYDADQTNSFLARFFLSALSQKSLVTKRIFDSGNRLAGFSIDYNGRTFKGISDFRRLIEEGIDD